MTKRVLLGASHSIIEPLGLLHLGTVAKQEGWDIRYVLVKDSDFSVVDDMVKEFKPDLFGFTLYSGNHVPVFDYLRAFRKAYPDIQTSLGGPHPTYFPGSCREYVDYVVVSEGFDSFRRILRGKVNPGIVHLSKSEPFTVAEREQFYKDCPDHLKSPIKSVITQTGCPFSCNYCFNSSNLDFIANDLSLKQLKEMSAVVGGSKKLFPSQIRSVDDVIEEIYTIKNISPETQMIYFQDDVFVRADTAWIKEFQKKFHGMGMNFHIQVRFEYVNPESSIIREKIDLLREAGCNGMTMAIESGNATIRKEVLNRPMKEELMFKTFEYLSKLNYRVRTEQMLGLPCGATSKETPINLESDIQTLALNVRLKQATGLPTTAWASIFTPYSGTNLGKYCKKYGFYSGDNADVPTTFFERSILNFPKHYMGEGLRNTDPNNSAFWYSPHELMSYKNDMQFLRDYFDYFAMIKDGDQLFRKVLAEKNVTWSMTPEVQDFQFAVSRIRRRHVYDHILYDTE
jgi:radical SAM superfamily enzyme YgiQ (UPF0313 family)